MNKESSGGVYKLHDGVIRLKTGRIYKYTESNSKAPGTIYSRKILKIQELQALLLQRQKSRNKFNSPRVYQFLMFDRGIMPDTFLKEEAQKYAAGLRSPVDADPEISFLIHQEGLRILYESARKKVKDKVS